MHEDGYKDLMEEGATYGANNEKWETKNKEQNYKFRKALEYLKRRKFTGTCVYWKQKRKKNRKGLKNYLNKNDYNNYNNLEVPVE